MRMMLMIAALLGAQDDKKPYFPLSSGKSWKYRISGTGVDRTEAEWKLGDLREITLEGGRRAKGWPLEGFAKAESYLVEVEHGAQIVTLRHVGYAGTPALVVVADLRWGGTEKWEFTTMDGCMKETVKCSRAQERVGEYDCVKIAVGLDQTYWVARGVGIVKRMIGTLPGTETWELVK